MTNWIVFSLLVLALLLSAPIAAFVALGRTRKLQEEVARLRGEVLRLRERMGEPPAPPNVETPAATAQLPDPAARVVPPEPAPDVTATAPASHLGDEKRKPGSDWAQVSASVERMVAANWLVWVGAAALALGGIFMVRFALEQGYFGPLARTLAATVAGLAMVAGSEWLRRRIPASAAGQIGRAPMAVAAAGAVTLYGAAYAAGPLYSLVSPELTLAGFVAASAVAVGLAVIHGPILAALGLVGGYAAPLLVGGAAPDPVLLLAYAFAVTLAGLVLVRAFDWRGIVWIALPGAGMWMLLGLSLVDAPAGPYAMAGYALALLLAATAFAWSDADARTVARAGQGDLPPLLRPNQTVIAALGFWIISGAGLLMAFGATGSDMRAGMRDPLMIALAIHGVAAVLVGWRKPAFQLVPLFGAVVFVVGLHIAPIDAMADRIAGGIGFQPFDDPSASTYRFLAFAWVGAMTAGLGGWLAMRTLQHGAVMAVASAFAPLGLLVITFNRLGLDQQHFVWGLAGGVIAALNLAALEGIRRSGRGLDGAKGAASAYALGAFAASMFGVGASLGQMWMTVLFAAHLPAIALIDRRFNLPALRLCASIAAMIVVARLLAPQEILGYPLSAMPVLNELLPLYGVPLLCFWGAARVFAANLKSGEAPLVQALDVGAITLLAALVGIEIRHAATGGDLAAGYPDLVEISAYTVALTGLAAGLAARLGAHPRPWLAVASMAVYAGAVLLAVLGLGLAVNPLSDAWQQRFALDGPPLLNLLAASYLPPAALFGVYSVLAQRQGRTTIGHVSGFIALALVFLYVTLEVRNAFHGPLSLALEPVTEGESYAYSIAWLLFAVATLVVGLMRRRIAIRHAAMAVLALSVAKVFLLDMASLTGVLRAASFMGLGVALIAIAYLYQRVVFRAAPP